jgi:serine/threonine-protein kinase
VSDAPTIGEQPTPHWALPRRRPLWKRALPYALAMGIGFVTSYAAMYAWLAPQAADAAPSVPDLVGRPADAARAEAATLGYTVTIGTPVPHPTIPEGVVIEQRPAAGAREASGTSITLVVSAGNRRTAVPAILGLSKDEAVASLEAVGLSVGSVVGRASALGRGTVLDARPVPGTMIGLPGSVTLIVSEGPLEVVVPDVLGDDFALAKALLAQVGLEADSAGVEILADVPPRSVTEQRPGPGVRVPSGTRVRLTLAVPR